MFTSMWTARLFSVLNRSTEYNAKWNKPVREKQIPYDFTHMWNLRNKTNEHQGEKREKGETKKGTQP